MKILFDSRGQALGERLSTYLAPTLKESPAEAEVISHKLMIRAGFIRRLASGIYTYLPLALRSLNKFESIVRKEMNKAGAKELLMPIILPAELWRETGRWEEYGPELLRIQDRHKTDYVVGPTHEEVITDLAKREIRSWRDLPINLYQIQNKFRDEIRPRFGLMRGREFIMKDAYSFDADEAGADKSYWKMYEAYINIFKQCGLKFAIVEADSGAIGGNFSHEFMVLADTGEDYLAMCPNCSYAANLEKASASFTNLENNNVVPELVKVDTPKCRTIAKVADFLKVKESNIIKSLLYKVDNEIIMVLLPGNRTVNPIKLKKALNGADAILLDEASAENLPIGYIGPVNSSFKIIADRTIQLMDSAIAGSNEKDCHYQNVSYKRDFKVEQWHDLLDVIEGDCCPKCNDGKLYITKGIEVGHVFKLGTKYSESLKAVYTNKEGNEIPLFMGCYGIGIGRVLAASIEQNNDKDGIIWPITLAPFQAAVLPLQIQNEAVMKAAEELFFTLQKLGIDCILDDRDERPGMKFKDADLIGYPFRITVSERSLADNEVEVKFRATKETRMIKLDNFTETISAWFEEAMALN